MGAFANWYIVWMLGESMAYIPINLTDSELNTIRYLIRCFEQDSVYERYSPSIQLMDRSFATKDDAIAFIKEKSEGYAKTLSEWRGEAGNYAEEEEECE